MAVILVVIMMGLAASACTGPFFYREVIVPTDPNRKPAAPTP